jgi:hypothetical protein
MIKRMRNMQPADRFVLLRTGEQYTMLRRENRTPSGTRYVVKKNDQSESSLHHSCHVELIKE